MVAANRDEQLDRPASAPRLWSDRSPALFAPEDLRAGGTWMGLNAAGLFVGITNRFAGGADPGAISRERRSRGLLVLDGLAAPSARDAFARFESMPGDLHNPFHLVLADRDAAYVVWSDGWVLHREILAPGLHVVTERSRGAAPSGREDSLADLDVPLEELRALLAVHRENPFDSTCVHADDHNYGTRSASFIVFDEGGPTRFEATAGPSCINPWEDLSGPMRAALGSGP